jgi:1-acyl-sn-glycerol-3-phosphate acyltransferase
MLEAMEAAWGLGRSIVYPMCRLLRWRIDGLEQVPEDGPVLLACNHISFLDPMAVLWLGDRRHRKIRFMAKAELWRVRGLRFFLVHTRQIPVKRYGLAASVPLDAARRALDAGECVCMYPEGTISPDLEPMAAKAGVGRLAVESGAPVVPVGIWGTHRLSTLGRVARPRIGVAVSMVVGEPLHIASDEDAVCATDRIMGAVVESVGAARRIYPQHPKRRGDDWWVRAPETAVLRATRPHPVT